VARPDAVPLPWTFRRADLRQNLGQRQSGLIPSGVTELMELEVTRCRCARNERTTRVENVAGWSRRRREPHGTPQPNVMDAAVDCDPGEVSDGFARARHLHYCSRITGWSKGQSSRPKNAGPHYDPHDEDEGKSAKRAKSSFHLAQTGVVHSVSQSLGPE
jgi:hypothetical protein